MRFLRSRRGAVLLGAAFLLALFLVRPGAQRLQSRIAASIGQALDRPVEIGSVRLRLLPQPGFDLSNFVVHDDPAFGAEPMLRAPEVTAAIALTSLLRGRLEIARLDLTEPSVNLVRDSSGHWNLESLLERAARTPIAPTGKRKAEVRPGFPYIEADRGRINLKVGPEKKPYSLTGADFSFWQDSEDQWSMRLKAQPVRTDFNLGDTGILRVNGSWKRAPTLDQTPVTFSLQWDRAQLGQVTQLISGTDKGWRGNVTLNASLSGSPSDLNFQTSATLQDFHRYDIVSGANLRLAAGCAGHYSTTDRAISKIVCAAPVGKGEIRIGGDARPLSRHPSYHLQLVAQGVPMESVVFLARHAKRNIPADLKANGTLDATFEINRARADSTTSWQGGGEARGVRLRSEQTQGQLSSDRIPFAVTGKHDRPRLHNGPPKAAGSPSASATRIELGPFHAGMGARAPVTVQGWISAAAYSFTILGESSIQATLQAARTIGLPTLQPAAEGAAHLDLHLGGVWKDFPAPLVTGTARLHSVRAEVRGMSAPLEITSARLQLTEDGVNVRNLEAWFAAARWRGSLAMPRPCPAAPCRVGFDLHADQIATDQLNRALNPEIRRRPWYRWLSRKTHPGPSLLSTLHAAGRLTADRIVVRGLLGTRAAARVEWNAGKLQVTDLRADVLGGRHVGEWKADFASGTPRYTGSGRLENVALGQVSNLMKDAWITGTATLAYQATTAGYGTADLLSAADGSLKFDVREGSLPHVALTGTTAPLLLHRFAGRLLLHDGKFAFQEGSLESPGGIYLISGTASLGRKLDLKLLRDSAHGFNITGTLAEPRVTASSTAETQAALKP